MGISTLFMARWITRARQVRQTRSTSIPFFSLVQTVESQTVAESHHRHQNHLQLRNDSKLSDPTKEDPRALSQLDLNVFVLKSDRRIDPKVNWTR